MMSQLTKNFIKTIDRTLEERDFNERAEDTVLEFRDKIQQQGSYTSQDYRWFMDFAKDFPQRGRFGMKAMVRELTRVAKILVGGDMTSADGDYMTVGDIVKGVSGKGYGTLMVITNIRPGRKYYDVTLKVMDTDNIFKLKTLTLSYSSISILKFDKRGRSDVVQKHREVVEKKVMERGIQEQENAQVGRDALRKWNLNPGDKVEIRYSNRNAVDTVVEVNWKTGKVGVRRFRNRDDESLVLMRSLRREMGLGNPRETRWISAQFIVDVVERAPKQRGY